MTGEDAADLSEPESEWINYILNRPRECSALEMELKTAMQLGDVAGSRELLREKGGWLSKFRSCELAELMDTAIGAGAVADELLALLLEAGVPPDSLYDGIGEAYQHTPLVTAARRGRLDLVRKLVDAGADLFWKSPTGANALSEILPAEACQAPAVDTPERAQVREWLLGQGLRIDPLCADSRRKLMWASSSPHSWADVPALVELGAPPDATGWTPFMFDSAAGRADARAVTMLTRDDLQHRDAWKRTPFLLAVEAGDSDLARALLEHGSDARAGANCGASALHLAAKNNHSRLMEWLIQVGLSLDVRDDFGHSPLHSAVGADSLEAADLLLQMGADVSERDKNDYGLIHSVPFSGELAMLKLLLGAGASVNDVSGGGSWPLRDACEAGNADAVAYLLQAGADPNLTSSGETALFTAVSNDNLECVRLLLEAGAEVNAADCDGWTCLFYLRSERIARFLLERGASPKIADQSGGLPEDWHRVPNPVRKMLSSHRLENSETKA